MLITFVFKNKLMCIFEVQQKINERTIHQRGR